jgi:DNA-directed RNA polymerase delta subunit
LIKDERFVLVGRGIYALRDWGYFPGQVKEVISKILQREQRPMTKEEIIREVLKQRMVKPETILMNLTNKNYFKRDESGRYYLVKEI